MTTVHATRTDETRIEGLAAAAMVSAGAGAFVLGLMTTLNDVSSGLNDFLRFDDGVGPLSGKTVIAAVAYFGALIVMGVVWRGRAPRLLTVLWIALALLVLGLVGTFPTFFEAFAD